MIRDKREIKYTNTEAKFLSLNYILTDMQIVCTALLDYCLSLAINRAIT